MDIFDHLSEIRCHNWIMSHGQIMFGWESLPWFLELLNHSPDLMILKEYTFAHFT